MDSEIHYKIFKEIAPKYIDFSDSIPTGVLKGLLEILAESASLIREHQKNVAKEAYVQSASGTALDYLVGQIGLERLGATKTIGQVIFGRNAKTDKDKDKSVVIKKNTILKTKLTSLGKEYRYLVTKEVTIPPGVDKMLVEVIAEESGIAYNVPEKYIIRLVNPISGIDYVENSSNWIITAGTNGESDSALRKRYFAKWGELVTGSNALAYESWARSVKGVTDVVVIPTPNGQKNLVDVIVSTTSTAAEEDNQIIKRAQSLIETNKPIGVDVMVYGPTPKLINMNIILHLLPSCLDSDVVVMATRVKEIINAMFVASDDYIDIFRIGEDFILDRFKQTIMNNVKGIKYIEFVIDTPSFLNDMFAYLRYLYNLTSFESISNFVEFTSPFLGFVSNFNVKFNEIKESIETIDDLIEAMAQDTTLTEESTEFISSNIEITSHQIAAKGIINVLTKISKEV